jgi:SAM-dependent methyltransferase
LKLDEWLKENELVVDWNLFFSPWDEMQLKHNPFRQAQIEAIFASAHIREKQSPIVLDLGCGPGVLGRQLANEKPLGEYFGLDGDPLMLAAMHRLLQGKRVRALQEDLRKTEWSRGLAGHFDSVVSLTALHWLSQAHQNETYLAAFGVLKPGGSFIVGDPYLPEDSKVRERLEALHYKRAAKLRGQTWQEFWQSFFEKYPIEQMYTDYHKEKGYQIPFEGSDEGYPISYHIKALRAVGFIDVSVFWKSDLRVVYGGKKPLS